MNALRTTLSWLSKHRYLTFLILALATAVSYGALQRYRASRGVLTEPLRVGTIADSVYGIGTVTASRVLQVRPGLVSHIERYFVKEGDAVRAGTALVSLDGNVTRAPFAGTITSLPFKNGENVYAQGPVLTLTDLSNRYVSVSLEQQGALRIRAGQKAKLSFESIRETTYDGEVVSVYPKDSNFLARIHSPGLPARILPGMTADVAILINNFENTILIPIAAISNRHVWRKRGQETPKFIPVETGVIDKEFAQMISGDIQVGDRLLIKMGANK